MSAYHALLTQIFSIQNPSHAGAWGEGLPRLVAAINDMPADEQIPPLFDSRDSRQEAVEWATNPHPVTGRKYRESLYRPNEAALHCRDVNYTGLHGCHPSLHALSWEDLPAPAWASSVVNEITNAIYGELADLPENTPYVLTAAAGRPIHLNDIEASIPEIPIFVLTLGPSDDARENVHIIDLSSWPQLTPRSLAFFRLAPIFDDRLSRFTAIIANSVCSLGVYTPHLLGAANAHKLLVSYNAWGFNPVCLHLAALPSKGDWRELRRAFNSLVGVAHWVYGADEIVCQATKSYTYIVESRDLFALEFFYKNTAYTSRGAIAGVDNPCGQSLTYPKVETWCATTSLELSLALPRPVTRKLSNPEYEKDAVWRGKGTIDRDYAALEPIPPPAPVIPILTGQGWVVPDGKVWRWNETNRGFRDVKYKDHVYICTPDPISDFTISEPRPDRSGSGVALEITRCVDILNHIFRPHTKYFVTAGDGAYLSDIALVQQRAKDFQADEVIIFAGHGAKGAIDHDLPPVHFIDVPYINNSGRSMMYYRLLPYIANARPGCQFVIGNIRAGDAPPLELRAKFWAAKRSVLSWNQYHRGPVMNAAHYGVVGDLDIKTDLIHLFTEFAHTYGPDELYFYKHDPVVVRQSSIWDSVAVLPTAFKCWPHVAFVLENGQITRLVPEGREHKYIAPTSCPFDRTPLMFTHHNFSGYQARFLALLHLNTSFASPVDTFALTIGTTGDQVPYKYMAKQIRRFTPRICLSLHLNNAQDGRTLLATLEGNGSLFDSVQPFGRGFEIAFLLAEHYQTIVPRQLFAQLPGQTLVDLEPSRLLTRGGEVPGNPLLTIGLKVARWLSFGYRISVTAGLWRMPRSADGEHSLRPTPRKRGRVLVPGSSTLAYQTPDGFERLTTYDYRDLAVDEVHATGNGTIETARYLGAKVTAIRDCADTTYLSPGIINFWPVINPLPIAAAAPFVSFWQVLGHCFALNPLRALTGMYTLLSLYSSMVFSWLAIALTLWFKGRQIFFGLTWATFFFGQTNMLTIVLGPLCFAICMALASHVGVIPVSVVAGRLAYTHFDLAALTTFVTIVRFPITLPHLFEAITDVVVYTNQSRVIVATVLPIIRGVNSTRYLVVRPFQFSSGWLPHVSLWDRRTELELSLEPTHFRAKIPQRVFYRSTHVPADELQDGALVIPIPNLYYATKIPGFKYLPLGNCFMVMASYGHIGLAFPLLLLFWKLAGLRLSLAVAWYALGQSLVTLCIRLHQL